MIKFLCDYNKKEVWEMFDCIGGTSIGGIIALGISSTLDGKNPTVSADKLIDFFEIDSK